MKDKESKNRIASGVATSALGVILNLLLAVSKTIAAVISGSVSVMSDAVNNFSDVATGCVSLSGFVVAGKKADSEHPFGHGRFEYVAALIIGLTVVVVGIELIISSVKSVISSAPIVYSTVAVITLIASVAVKSFMAVFYFVRNHSLKSDTVRAAAFDSLSDCIVTSLILISYALEPFVGFSLDGVTGILAAVFIIVGAVKIAASTVGKLIGGRDGETEKKIEQLMKGQQAVLGWHDLCAHDYGEGKRVASVDAEFDKNLTFADVHDVVDKIEREAFSRFGINLVVHCDPIDVSNVRLLELRRVVIASLEEYGRAASFHELNIDDERREVSLHLRLTEPLMREKEKIVAELIEKVGIVMEGYGVSVKFDFM